MLRLLLLVIFGVYTLNAVVYESYYGNLKPLTKSQYRQYVSENNTRYCTVNVKLPCDPHGWKRLDGSCNNLKHPSLGTQPAASIRVLQPKFSPNYEPVKTKSGKDFPLARYLRTEILSTGRISDLRITQLLSYYVLFMLNDVNSIHDILNYIFNDTICCTPEGRKEYTCTPTIIPKNDPVHRFSGVRCMNLTRPDSYQTFGCLKNGTKFTRIEFATPVFDMSEVYNYMPGAAENIRSYEDGLLKVEIDNGKIFPPSTGTSNPRGEGNMYSNICALNQLPSERRCNKYLPNGVVSSNTFNILFYRHHNVIAKKLKEINPCWDDNRLYFTARDINIAIVIQIYYHEMLPVVFGRENLIREGVISCSDGFRDVYGKNVFPQISDEYVYVLRYFHLMQDDILQLYDNDGHFLKTFPMVNCTTRTGMLPIDNFIDKLIQGSFRQASGKFDHTIDYDMVDRILGGMQFSSDVSTSDLNKGRYFGFQHYIKYREFCSKQKYKSFSDLKDVMTVERIYRLSQLYESVEDVELMAGIWSENHHPGSRLPYTVYCLLVNQLKRSLVSDRHWYERPNRPHAFTLDQLKAIRHVTIAGILCAVGDGVTKIQPHAFYSKSMKNPILDCSSERIGKLNLTPWKDPECAIEEYIY